MCAWPSVRQALLLLPAKMALLSLGVSRSFHLTTYTKHLQCTALQTAKSVWRYAHLAWVPSLIVDSADWNSCLCCSAVCCVVSLYGDSAVQIYSQHIPSDTTVGKTLAACAYCHAIRTSSPLTFLIAFVAVQEHHVKYLATGSP